MNSASFSKQLIAWQSQHGRHDLPWVGITDPYRVWLSEIMLQQTQVSTVLGYYERFITRFPDVSTLAQAPLDDVLARWAGLGYYSRARNLHRCAQMVFEQHGGHFPGNSLALAELPGIGRSTAAAIAAFCFGERVAILDGNVKRVLARLLAFEGDMAQNASVNTLWDRATELLPQHGVQAYTQGLMDLGAGICKPRKPLCEQCPVANLCQAHAQQQTARYPIKTRKLKRTQRQNWCLWLHHHNQVWLEQRPPTGVWAGLWSLPFFDSLAPMQALAETLQASLQPLPSFRHVLTHFDWQLHPHVLALEQKPLAVAEGVGAGRWFSFDELDQIGLPAPIRRLLMVEFN